MKTIFIISFLFLISNYVNGGVLNHKPFLCNYDDGVLKNPNLLETGDPCIENGPSKYKFYIDKKFLNINECNIFIDDYASTEGMKNKYPTDKWMIGCDKKW
tara:strand:- start:349 stop:651 length:303 start_codon:yes stop_codon:yes gene_type:complete